MLGLRLQVEFSEQLPDDGVPGWWSMVKDGWRGTVDSLVSQLD